VLPVRLRGCDGVAAAYGAGIVSTVCISDLPVRGCARAPACPVTSGAHRALSGRPQPWDRLQPGGCLRTG